MPIYPYYQCVLSDLYVKIGVKTKNNAYLCNIKSARASLVVVSALQKGSREVPVIMVGISCLLYLLSTAKVWQSCFYFLIQQIEAVN